MGPPVRLPLSRSPLPPPARPQELLQYCDSHQPPGFRKEAELTRELVALLPPKIDALTRSAAAPGGITG